LQKQPLDDASASCRIADETIVPSSQVPTPKEGADRVTAEMWNVENRKNSKSEINIQHDV
jgi:hypothetical protein